MLKMFLARGLEVGSLLIFWLLNCSSTNRDQDWRANQASKPSLSGFHADIQALVPLKNATYVTEQTASIFHTCAAAASLQGEIQQICCMQHFAGYMKKYAALQGLGEGKLHLCKAVAIHRSDLWFVRFLMTHERPFC